jgi:hypothetical protein
MGYTLLNIQQLKSAHSCPLIFPFDILYPFPEFNYNN